MLIHTHSPPTLGIDIGRVIIGGGPDGPEDTTFLTGSPEAALQTPAMPGAFEAIRDLTAAFDGRVWLISKAGAKIQARSREWLAHHGFYRITGVNPQNLRFCLERREKAGICVSLRVTHFIDDRADVLRHMMGLVPHLYLFGAQRSPTPQGMEWVQDWRRAQTRLVSQGNGP